MNQNVNLTSFVKKTSFASDLIKIFFQDNNSYFKNTIMIDEKIRKRCYSCECFLIKDEIFQKNNCVHFEQNVYENRKMNVFKTMNDEKS